MRSPSPTSGNDSSAWRSSITPRSILKSLEERDLLTEATEAAPCEGPEHDCPGGHYQPYRLKRRTRAMIAKEKGLEPLADLLLDEPGIRGPLGRGGAYVDAGKGVNFS